MWLLYTCTFNSCIHRTVTCTSCTALFQVGEKKRIYIFPVKVIRTSRIDSRWFMVHSLWDLAKGRYTNHIISLCLQHTKLHVICKVCKLFMKLVRNYLEFFIKLPNISVFCMLFRNLNICVAEQWLQLTKITKTNTWRTKYSLLHRLLFVAI